MLTAVSELLKGTFNESLKKLLQPAGIIAASVFLLLNVLFIVPTLEAQGVQLAVALNQLDDGWKFLLFAAFVIVFAYVLLSLGSTILRLMTGELLTASSPLRNRTVYTGGNRRDLARSSFAPQTRIVLLTIATKSSGQPRPSACRQNGSGALLSLLMRPTYRLQPWVTHSTLQPAMSGSATASTFQHSGPT